MTRLVCRAPATSANLGPGFDSLALALDLWNEAVVDTEGEPGVVVEGEGAAELPEDETNLLVRSMEETAAGLGRALPPLRVACRNDIPLERGLGSSAAAVVAGVLLADSLLGAEMSAGERLERATAIEGHPDNVAACLLGGLVVCYRVAAGLRAERLEPHPELHPVALVPEDQRLSTEAARRSLPSQVPFADAVHTAGRAALAVLAFTGRPDLLADALDDRLHERHRMELAPASGAVLRGLRDEGIPACVSGAGPALLAFPPAGRTIENLPSGWRARPLDVAVRGASILAS